MTRRLFKNRDAVKSLKLKLDESANRSESQKDFEKRKILNDLENTPSGLSFKYPILAFAALIIFSTAVWIFINYNSKKETSLNPDKFLKGLVSFKSSKNLFNNSNITIDKTDGAKFLFNDATWWLKGASQLKNLNSDKVSVTLKKGSMLAVYDSRKNRSSAEIKTPNGTIIIKGTLFSLHETSKLLTLRLFEGSVLIGSKSSSQTVKAGQYVTIKNGQITATRLLNKTDVIAALLIAEQTILLNGTKVPDLPIPASPATSIPKTSVISVLKHADSDKTKLITPIKAKASPAKKEIKQPTSDDTEQHIKHLFLEPDKDEMKIKDATSQPDQIEARKKADILLKDACESLRKGNSKDGKEKIEQYLRKYHKDPYWDNLNGIMSPLD